MKFKPEQFLAARILTTEAGAAENRRRQQQLDELRAWKKAQRKAKKAKRNANRIAAKLAQKVRQKEKAANTNRPPGVNRKRDPFYRSAEWKRVRYQALLRSKGRCECCGASPERDGIRLNVDHIKPAKRFPELRAVLSNLQVLCADCNRGKGGWDQTDWRVDEAVELDAGYRAVVAG